MSDEYQAEYGPDLKRHDGCAWGVHRIPETEVKALGDVSGKDVLEVGCGAAQFSIGLAKRGALCHGLDISKRQLEHAADAASRAGINLELTHGTAEELPYPSRSFDIVFGDHGAFDFADPAQTVPEASRVLRVGGFLAINIASPIADICWSEAEHRLTRSLSTPYFGLRNVASEGTLFQLPYGEWIALFRQSHLQLVELLELRTPPGQRTRFLTDEEADWADKWPAEALWRATKVAHA